MRYYSRKGLVTSRIWCKRALVHLDALQDGMGFCYNPLHDEDPFCVPDVNVGLLSSEHGASRGLIPGARSARADAVPAASADHGLAFRLARAETSPHYASSWTLLAVRQHSEVAPLEDDHRRPPLFRGSGPVCTRRRSKSNANGSAA